MFSFMPFRSTRMDLTETIYPPRLPPLPKKALMLVLKALAPLGVCNTELRMKLT